MCGGVLRKSPCRVSCFFSSWIDSRYVGDKTEEELISAKGSFFFCAKPAFLCLVGF